MNEHEKQLTDFSLPQLHMVLKHLRLGVDHLKLMLTKNQYKELLKWCELTRDQKKQIATDTVERLGNMSLIINTILTSTFGAWMGLSGCIGLTLGNYAMLCSVTILAFFVSGLIGYVSLSMTKKQALNARDNQKLHNAQLKVLQIINQKLNEKSDSHAFYLNTATFLLEDFKGECTDKKENGLFTTKLEAYHWLDHFKRVLKLRLEDFGDFHMHELYRTELMQNTYRIQKSIGKHIDFVENLAEVTQKQKKELRIVHTLPFLKVLSNPLFAVPKHKTLFAPFSWAKGNFRTLLLGLIPTIWGGFASMFVFVGGIPNIARELGFSELATLLSEPTARVIEISLAGAVTLYFAFSYLYSSKKCWQRQRILERTQKEIANEETLVLENTQKLKMLNKVKMYTQRIVSVFNILKKLDNNLIPSNNAEETQKPCETESLLN